MVPRWIRIIIRWFYQSYITSTSQFVTATRNGEIDTIMRCNPGGIVNIFSNHSYIVIQMYHPSNYARYIQKSEAFGFQVKIDSLVSVNEYNRVYNPEFYVKPKEKTQ
jgi:hypothetical protein